MKSINAIVSQAEKQCQDNGTRLTAKRKLVLTGLLASDKALSAYELMDRCREVHGESIPAMSVYRILEFLEQEQLVHKLSLANKYVACSHIACDHAHEVPQFLICTECQAVREISIRASTLRDLKKGVQSAGYRLVSQQIELSCICESCFGKVA